MNKLEQAARQALEALEVYEIKLNSRLCNEAITALREALAEQATVSGGLCGGCAKKAADGWALYCVECWEQAEQEPVCCVADLDVLQRGFMLDRGYSLHDALYAAPVRTKDLSDDELCEIEKPYLHNNRIPLGGQYDFARAVIAADRAKNLCERTK